MNARDIERLFIRTVSEYSRREREKRANELHLTDLTEQCMRRVWFEKHSPLPEPIDNLLRMLQGTMLHAMPLLKYHELELEFEGVKTRIDEYDDESGVLIEKKFVTFIPRTQDELMRYYSHYVKQVEYETLILTANDKPVNRAFLLFVCRGEPDAGRPPISVFEVSVNVDSVLDRFIAESRELEQMLKKSEPPPIPDNYSPFEYPCTYCKYVARCFST